MEDASSKESTKGETYPPASDLQTKDMTPKKIPEEEEEEYSVHDKTREYKISFLKSMIDEQREQQSSEHSQRLRQKFLSKLAYKHVWVHPNKKPKASQSVIIFDWDDTLMCTSTLVPMQNALF